MGEPEENPKVAVVIVAAGRGLRAQQATPKQFVPLGQASAFRRSVDVFLDVDAVSWIVPVIHPDDRALSDEALSGCVSHRLLPAVVGGDTRAHSVRNGLEALASSDPDLVLIHDSARPFLPRRVIDDVIAALRTSEGACAALPVVDALWLADGTVAERPVPREGLWRAQTPQGFHFAKILAAHRAHDGSGTDDVAVAKDFGLDVVLVQGSEDTFKITTPEDIDRALAHIGERD